MNLELDYSSFDLPFFEEVSVVDMNTDEQYEKMESLIPKNAKYLSLIHI